MKKYDTTALGEILIDFTFAGVNADGKNLYEENVGGAPANAAAAVAKLGGKSAFIGMTGQDSFGVDVKNCLANLGVETKGMRVTTQQHTTLAFVSLDANGERHFSFCRNPGADTQLSEKDLDEEILNGTKILHIGSLSLTDEPSKSATLKAIQIVKKAGGLVSYDPNWRANLWKGRSDALDLLRNLFVYADIVKISDEEMALLFGKDATPQATATEIRAQGVKLVLITLGPKGVYYSFADYDGVIGCPEVHVVDTTGAGDSFNGGLQYKLTRKDNPLDVTKAELEEALVFANAVASLCVTKRGAIPALPDLPNVEDFLAKH